VSLRIADIVDNPAMRTRVLAGKGGMGRQVDLAHATEVEKPWEWISAGELLLTLGRNFPESAADQLDFVRNLAAAGIVGLDLAEGWFAPPLTPEAAKLADELDFPIIETAYEVPFAMISRAVAEATSRSSQVSMILQMYECYRKSSLAHRSEEQSLLDLGNHLGFGLTIVNTLESQVLLPVRHHLPSMVTRRIHAMVEAEPLPAVRRIECDNRGYLVVPIADEPLAVVAQADTDQVDLMVMHHLAALAALIAERYRAQTESRATSGGRLLSQLLAGTVDRELASERLATFGLEVGPWRVMCPSGCHAEDLVSIHAAFMRNEVPAIATLGDDGLIILSLASQEWPDTMLVDVFGPDGFAGVSAQVNALSRLADGAREAHWAREGARSESQRIATYGVDEALFMPRTVAGAEAAVASVLGPLIDYDAEHGSELVHSLRVFFDANRSWQAASRALGVHRQTLVYRMQRVSELTERNLADVHDIAELHLALRAKDLLDRI
jgi:Purine catabolism regulatory protein-like family/PucR C-terminal helix-turn-helix domain